LTSKYPPRVVLVIIYSTPPDPVSDEISLEIIELVIIISMFPDPVSNVKVFDKSTLSKIISIEPEPVSASIEFLIVEFLRKKWIVDLIYEIHLLKTPYYSDLHKNLPEINTRSLSKQLSELEDLGMINREIKTGKPIRVYYELTDFGLGIYELLIPLLSFFSFNIEKSRKIIPS